MKIEKIFLISICILAILTIGVVSANDNITDLNKTDSTPNIEVPEKIWKYGDNNITIESTEDANVDITGAITYNTTITTGKTSIPIKNLTAGVHNIAINYLSNLTSFQNEYNITVLKENPDWDLDFTGLDGEITLDSYSDHELNMVYGDIINSPEGLTGNFSFYVDGELYTEFNAQEHGKFIYYEEYFKFKDYNFTLTYSGDDYFKPATKSKILSVKEVVIKIPSTVILGYKDEILVDRYYLAEGTLSIYINGKLYKKEELTELNYSYKYLRYSLNHLKPNKTYDIEAIFSSPFENITKKATVTVNNRDYVSFDKTNIFVYGEENYCFNGPNINLDISIDGEKVQSQYKNRQHIINISSLKPGPHIITVNYNGDKTFAKNTFSTTFEITVKPNYTREVKQNEANNLSLTLPDDFRGNLTIEVAGEDNKHYLYETVELTNSHANIQLPTSHIGKFVIRAYFTGNYEINEMVGLYTVKYHATWDINPGWFHEGLNEIFFNTVALNEECYLNLTMAEDAVGNLTVQLKKDNGEYAIYEILELKNGKANIMLPSEHAGEYHLKLSFEGNYELASLESCYDVDSEYHIIGVIMAYYGSEESIKLKLPQNGTGTLTLEIKYNENDTYTLYKTVNLVNGKASIEFPTNRIGKIYYNIIYDGNYEVRNWFNYSTTIYPIFAFKNNEFSIQTDNETTGTLYVFEDATDKEIYAANIINGKSQIDVTDYLKEIYSETYVYGKAETSAGIFYGEIETLDPIFDIIITADDVSMYYADGHTFKATIYRNNRTVPAGEEITIKIGSETYHKTTDNNGTVKIKLTQIPNKYTIITKYKVKKVENTLNVKQVLTLKKVNVRKSAKKLILTATIKNGKTALKGKQITFKFNGKKYTTKTNKKGVAKVTIKKSVLKKLKAGKKITYSATYLKDKVKRTVKIGK